MGYDGGAGRYAAASSVRLGRVIGPAARGEVVMLSPNQRVKVDLSRLTIQGVVFSENVREVLATVLQQTSTDPPAYLVELLFSFRGVKRVEVPEERIRPA
jgi:hypothetical protein